MRSRNRLYDNMKVDDITLTARSPDNDIALFIHARKKIHTFVLSRELLAHLLHCAENLTQPAIVDLRGRHD